MLTGSSIGTFIPRIDLLALLSNMQIPEWGIDWLKHEQVALMAALLHIEQVFSLWDNGLDLAASLSAFLAAVFKRRRLMKLLNFF
ncbi:AzlD domain-containing protein [[Brevibacterium] frigoritolerans]|uniref:AzlD domain-containing protein n=1 Tax=Peribacillus frigoritolerans TaxID=450367 RepID=A0A941FP44_9BACI|nr:AzlD domain-containing protein [Peribacillus frigoritolerans]